jgi:hypothetical protein
MLFKEIIPAYTDSNTKTIQNATLLIVKVDDTVTTRL